MIRFSQREVEQLKEEITELKQSLDIQTDEK